MGDLYWHECVVWPGGMYRMLSANPFRRARGELSFCCYHCLKVWVMKVKITECRLKHCFIFMQLIDLSNTLFAIHIMDQSKRLSKDLTILFILRAESQLMYKSTICTTFVGYTFLSMSMFEVSHTFRFSSMSLKRLCNYYIYTYFQALFSIYSI